MVSAFPNWLLGKKSNVRFYTFEDAARACNQRAYQNDEIVSVVVEKNAIFRDTLKVNSVINLNSVRTLIALAGVSGVGKLKVIDFGGGGGYHYQVAKAVLGTPFDLRWHVVETKAMAREAQRLADDHLKFFDDLDLAREIIGDADLVFSSSALQYCPEPLSFLQKLVDIGAPYLFLTRTPFNDGNAPIITVQKSRISDNGPGPLPLGFKDKFITYPITYVSRQQVEAILQQKYDIRFQIDEGEGSFHFGQEVVQMNGYFCQLRA